MFLILGLILLLPAGILLQIFRVNVVEGEGLRELWSTQAIDYIPIPAQRGYIYDAKGSLLATNTVIYKVAVDPHAPGTTRDDLNRISEVLSRHTGESTASYRNRISNAPARSRYIVLERSINVQAYEDLSELDIRGVILEEEYRRSYNFGSLASHLLGFVNHNVDGMGGLEAHYNDILKGEDGLQQVRKDRANRVFAYVGAPRKLPVQGLSLHTTIDAFIQAIAEEELKAGVERNRAKHGTAIVMDPKTGAIKAMANYPTFDPNTPAATETENRRNFAVADMIEPGSTFKLVTAVAAVELGLVDFDELFVTPESGQKRIHGQMMRDHDPLGTLTFPEVISKSSNIATSEIAMRINPDVFYQYARNMGFGTPANIDLPGEREGRLQKPYEWSKVTLPWMSIGYEVQATPLQLLQAYGAFANNGLMMKPYVVDRITDEFGNTHSKTEPSSVRRIAKQSTIEKLMPVFEAVLSDSGTADWAAVEGLRIAGKTGTAQKYIDGRYQARYRASFAGFFPVENPRYVMLVLLDEPRTSIYGGYTAGSIFKEIATRIAGLDQNVRRNLAPEKTIALSDSVFVPRITGLESRRAGTLLRSERIPFLTTGEGPLVVSQYPEPGQKIAKDTALKIELGQAEPDSVAGREGYARIPELRGMSIRQATTLLMSRGFGIDINGSGTIASQFPRPGEILQQGRTVTVQGKSQSMQQASSLVVNE